MRSESFAEILKEKIEKSKNPPANSHFSRPFTKENPTQLNVSESLNLAHFQSRMFEHRPNVFKSSYKSGVKQTSYNQTNSQSKSSETSHSGQFHAHKEQTAKRTQEPAKPQTTTRIRKSAHKLTDAQTKSMTYFINESMFLLEDFTMDELKKAYKRLAMQKHPDRQNGSPQFFIELTKHYETLSSVHKP